MTEAESIDQRPYHHGDLRRTLIDAALALVSEEQDWAFSLREVARRAGVSHNAPYNHFPEKRDLLGAVAAAGFEALRDRMRAAVAGVGNPRTALLASATAYVHAGVENPALYRLMFGPALAAPLSAARQGTTKADGGRPAEARMAGAAAKAVLDEVILRGAESGAFAISARSKSELASAALSIWSAVHGLTLLVIDALTGSELAIDTLVGRLVRTLLEGLEPR
ncbi:MAG: TetR/AcrR family transcriptional regulator [Methylovirgula sp.]